MPKEGTTPPLGRLFSSFSPENTPADLVVVYLWTFLSALAIYAPVVNETPFRVILALPMVLFFPGYSLIAALFPGRGEIDGLERLALSFGLSIAVVPLIGLVLNYTPFGIRLDPVVTSLVIFTLCMAVSAQVRRAGLPRSERFEVPFREMWTAFRAEFFPSESSRIDRALSAILLIAIVAAVATTVYVVVVPKEGEKFTEFYILGKEGKAADYPTDLRAGQAESVIIGVGNHEYRNVTYFVEIHLVQQEFDPATNTSTVLSMERIASFPVTLVHNTTYQEQHTFSVNRTGGNQLKFLLFMDESPPDSLWGAERINQSYRDLHLWVRVR
ncbi:MAG TPA: DUF1616 domain-containing protein [Methanolinea sp.]|nr:DUF1616 domain-containing protein [Methanolinea sp.]HQK55707.1 DUF1616 domain-containing protein [Methanolinea sp.]